MFDHDVQIAGRGAIKVTRFSDGASIRLEAVAADEFLIVFMDLNYGARDTFCALLFSGVAA